MNKSLKSVFITVSLAALAGCSSTHIKSVRTIDTGTTDDKMAKAELATRIGAPYRLQFTQFTIKVTHQVVDCPTGAIKTSNKASVTSKLVDDGDFAYAIPLDTLTSPFKVTNLELKYTNGRLTAINAEAEDRTAQTILASIQGIGTIARAVSGSAVSDKGIQEGCKDEVIQALVNKGEAEGDIKTQKRKVDQLNGEVTRLTAAYEKSKNDPTIRTRLTNKVSELEAETMLLGQAEKELKAALKVITYERTIIWPRVSKDFETKKALGVPHSVIAKWYDYPKGAGVTDADHETAKKARFAELAEPMQLWLAIDRIGSFGRDPSLGIQKDSAPASAGIRLRVPANGKLLVCQGATPCSRDPAVKNNLVTAFDSTISQLGLIYYAGFKSRPFSNGSFELVVDAEGRPEKIAFAEKSSRAEVAAGLAKDLGGEFSTIYGALNKTEAEKTAERIAELEQQQKEQNLLLALDPDSPANQLAALEMQKKLIDARQALVQPDTFELARLTAIAQQQKEYDDALLALADDPNQQVKEQRLAIEAETLRLNAEAARIEAEVRIRDAKERLNAS